MSGYMPALAGRFIALIVDTILILLIGIIVVAFFSLTRGLQNALFLCVQQAPIDSLTRKRERRCSIVWIDYCRIWDMLIIVIPWLYYAGFESSRSQATPGKLLMRIVVTDLEGNKPTFARVTLRHFAKIISALIIFIGFLMIGLTKKRQGLHDKIAGCLVLLQE